MEWLLLQCHVNGGENTANGTLILTERPAIVEVEQKRGTIEKLRKSLSITEQTIRNGGRFRLWN